MPAEEADGGVGDGPHLDGHHFYELPRDLPRDPKGSRVGKGCDGFSERCRVCMSSMSPCARITRERPHWHSWSTTGTATVIFLVGASAARGVRSARSSVHAPQALTLANRRSVQPADGPLQLEAAAHTCEQHRSRLRHAHARQLLQQPRQHLSRVGLSLSRARSSA